MKFGWATACHREITATVLETLPFTDEEKRIIIDGALEPDRLLPFNFMDHIQTPTKGNARNAIIVEMGKHTVRSLGHAIHFVQDLCNLFHTTDKTLVDHVVYEMNTKCAFHFAPDRKISIFKDGLPEGLDNLIEDSRSEGSYAKRMTRAAYASYELCLLYLNFIGRKY